jgi:hypothetical protein
MRKLPLFPLELVVFPNEPLNLHIFEPRYLQLIGECERDNTTFGIPAFLDGKVSSCGTEVYLDKVVDRHPNGTLDITVIGLGRFRIARFFSLMEGKMYAGGQIIPLKEDERPIRPRQNAVLRDLFAEFFQLAGIQKPLPGRDQPFTVFSLGHLAGLSLEQEYEMLQMECERERQDFLTGHLQEILPVIRGVKELQERVKLNGHFRDLKPLNF